MNIKKICLMLVAISIIFICGFVLLKVKPGKEDNYRLKIVTSNFASYDFLRAIIGENKDISLKFLIGPGKEAHSYDPTANDLIEIKNADLFVYLGGEVEKWSDKILKSIDEPKGKIVCISDFVEKIKEEEIDGIQMEENEEDEENAFDDHIWTSPDNCMKMVDALEKIMEEIDEENKERYSQNAKLYIAEIQKVDSTIQEIVKNKVRDRLIFADRMPMQYFINYYGLNVSAAFSGCSLETEPSASTIVYLQNKIKEEKIPVVLYIELNNGKVAKTIANEIEGCEALQIQTLHNVSLEDFKNGETWVSLMTRNIDVLKKALQ